MRSRTSNALILALAALVVLVVRGSRRQRRAYQATITRLGGGELVTARQVRRRLHAVMLLMLGNWIGDRIDSVRGFFSGIGNDLYGFVRTLIDYAAGLLLDLINLAVTGLTNALNGVVGALVALKNYAEAIVRDAVNGLLSLLNTVANGLRNLIDNLGSLLASAVRNLVSAIGTALNDALNFARAVGDLAMQFARNLVTELGNGFHTLLNLAVTGLENLIRSIRDELVSGLQSLGGDLVNGLSFLGNHLLSVIADVRDFIIQHVEQLLSNLAHDLTAGLSALRDDVLAAYNDVSAFLRDHVAAVVQIVEAVADWLIWLAKLPFSSAVELARAWRSLTLRHVIENVPDASRRLAPHVLDHLTKDLAG